MKTRRAAVAGLFYPDAPAELSAQVTNLLADAGESDRAGTAAAAAPKVLIAPHAGYVYSGPIAASAYRSLEPARLSIRRVVLLGPSHRVYLQGMAFPSADSFRTPLGDVPLDRGAIELALQLAHTVESDEAHAQEHCLEVQLPFLQTMLGDFSLIPFVVGQCPPAAVADVLETLWGGDETLILVSSDLSHYLPYTHARVRDAATSRAIEARATDLTGEDACGAHAINGLMQAAREHDLRVRTLDLRNSGDTAGDQSQVVGYGAYALA